MIVQCPNCATKYNFPDDKFKEGRKLRCAACKFVFALTAPKQAPEEPDLFSSAPEEEVQPETGPEPVGFEQEEVQPETGPEPEAEIGPDEPAEQGLNLGAPSESQDFDLDFSEEGKGGQGVEETLDFEQDMGLRDKSNLFDLDSAAKKKARGKRKKTKSNRLSSFLALLIILAAAAGGAVYYFAPQYFPFDYIPLPKRGEAPQPPVEVKSTGPAEETYNFELQKVRRFYVKNENAGQLFVVEGEVVNRYSVPKELVAVSVSLFDKSGIEVVGKKQLCGNKVDLFKLQMHSKEQIESALNDKVGILTTNTDIPPGGEIPFQVVFYDPPETVHELFVKVAEAKDPPKK